MSERVWCVPASMVQAAGEGFWRWPDPAAGEAFAARLNLEGEFRERAAVETDETWRQVIPYLLLRSPSGAYFTYRRLPASGEARLVDRWSVGVGGHINDEHLRPLPAIRSACLRPNLLYDGLRREMDEELELPADEPLGELRLHGFLALSATPVDRVHVGLVVIAEVAATIVDRVDVRERDKLERVGWLPPAELRARLATSPFEGWSAAVITGGLP